MLRVQKSYGQQIRVRCADDTAALVRHAMVKRTGIRSGRSAAARSRYEGRDTGGESLIIGANGALRSAMARVHADARRDASLHYSLCHHDPRRGI